MHTLTLAVVLIGLIQVGIGSIGEVNGAASKRIEKREVCPPPCVKAADACTGCRNAVTCTRSTECRKATTCTGSTQCYKATDCTDSTGCREALSCTNSSECFSATTCVNSTGCP